MRVSRGRRRLYLSRKCVIIIVVSFLKVGFGTQSPSANGYPYFQNPRRDHCIPGLFVWESNRQWRRQSPCFIIRIVQLYAKFMWFSSAKLDFIQSLSVYKPVCTLCSDSRMAALFSVFTMMFARCPITASSSFGVTNILPLERIPVIKP